MGGGYIIVAAGALTIIVEKLDRSASACGYSHPPPNATAPELVTFELGGSFAGIAQLFVWYRCATWRCATVG